MRKGFKRYDEAFKFEKERLMRGQLFTFGEYFKYLNDVGYVFYTYRGAESHLIISMFSRNVGVYNIFVNDCKFVVYKDEKHIHTFEKYQEVEHFIYSLMYKNFEYEKTLLRKGCSNEIDNK